MGLLSVTCARPPCPGGRPSLRRDARRKAAGGPAEPWHPPAVRAVRLAEPRLHFALLPPCQAHVRHDQHRRHEECGVRRPPDQRPKDESYLTGPAPAPRTRRRPHARTPRRGPPSRTRPLLGGGPVPPGARRPRSIVTPPVRRRSTGSWRRPSPAPQGASTLTHPLERDGTGRTAPPPAAGPRSAAPSHASIPPGRVQSLRHRAACHETPPSALLKSLPWPVPANTRS